MRADGQSCSRTGAAHEPARAGQRALLLRAAKTLEPLDPKLARETYLDAWSAALFAGRLATTGSVHHVSGAALAAPGPAGPRRPSDSLLDGFALAATGEKMRKRTVDTRDELTAQERQIGRLARDGLSNPEIGARLFLSPRTVEWHLRKVFAKLGIHSRRELVSALPSTESELVPA
jgi:DNA-binding CsgD family transcriptional regulator